MPDQPTSRAESDPKEKFRFILHQRAQRLLSRRQREDEKLLDANRYLVVAVADASCAIPLYEVAEILPMKRCTQVPGAPKSVLGVINLRGEICPVLDLAGTLGMAASGRTGGYVLLIRGHKRPVGVRIDSIDTIRPVPASEIRPLDSGEAEGHGRLATGVLTDSTIVIDTKRVLSLIDLA